VSFFASLGIGLRALRINKTRTILTMLGIIVGIAAVVCMVSVGAGAQAEVSEKIRTLGTNLLLVVPGAENSAGVRREAGTQHTLTEDDATAIRRELGEVEVAAPVLSRSMQVIAGDRNWATLVAGTTADYLVAREWRVLDGRLFAASEIERAGKVAIIGSVLADELFDGHAPLGQILRIGNVPFTIIGVLDKKGQGAAGRSQDDVVFIPLSTAQSRVLGAVQGGMRSALNFVLIKVADAQPILEAKSEITALLRERHHLRRDAPDNFTIENPADVLTAREETLRTFAYLLTSVASVSLIVGGISIMNIMLVQVSERTREIGLRMAVGARRCDIRRQFLAEAVALAMTGGILGAAAGCVAAAAVAWNAGWPVLISPEAIVLAWGFAGVVGVSFGLYPAHRASRLDPISALRFE
jgi:putative ABC transport system permease protein